MSLMKSLREHLDAEKIQCEWEQCNQIRFFADCDFEAMKFMLDRNDWLLYGFSYKTNGDSIEIDFENKKRKKYVIADFGRRRASVLLHRYSSR